MSELEPFLSKFLEDRTVGSTTVLIISRLKECPMGWTNYRIGLNIGCAGVYTATSMYSISTVYILYIL